MSDCDKLKLYEELTACGHFTYLINIHFENKQLNLIPWKEAFKAFYHFQRPIRHPVMRELRANHNCYN